MKTHARFHTKKEASLFELPTPVALSSYDYAAGCRTHPNKMTPSRGFEQILKLL
ncbi:hypothetical protein J4216_05225 [Candidatus Woesearchaeota archaeon]|nr:hypothetical protein [Candidatus Woesearchaeota archaeon]